jgi:hypothetical protein
MRRLVPSLVLVSCTVALGTMGCGGDEAGEPQTCTLLPCLGDLRVLFAGEFDFDSAGEFDGTSDGEPFACRIATGSCDRQDVALEIESSYEVQLEFRDRPETVEVSFREGESIRVEERITPVYESVELNGPGCGFCTSAVVTRTISPAP